jgi:hypothetical protein
MKKQKQPFLVINGKDPSRMEQSTLLEKRAFDSLQDISDVSQSAQDLNAASSLL